VGRLAGSQGFARIVAIKRLHSQYGKDPEFVEMFVDEARLAARVRHPNVVSTLDVVEGSGELLVVMEYIHGETLARVNRKLRDRGERVPPDIAAAIMLGVLQGLHAAHEAKTEHGASLGIVHRDVSPQNIIVGADGTPRVLDFGVAKAAWRAVTTQEGQVKGKLSYMAPEQVNGLAIDRRVDIYAAGIVFWETLTGARLFEGDNPGMLTARVLEGAKEPPSARVSGISTALDELVMKALERKPENRYATAMEMAVALEKATPIATSRRVGEWLSEMVGDSLAERARYVEHVERTSSPSMEAAIAIDVPMDRPETPTHVLPLPAPPASVREPGSLSRGVVTRSEPSALEGQPRPRSLARPLAFGIGAACIVVLGAYVMMRSRHDTAAPVVASSAPPSAETSAAPSEPAPPPPQPPPATATAAPPATADASARPVTKPVARPAAPVKTAAAKCDPPYTIDAKGVRVPKRECF
jgi:serine/threonine-protein kinase